MAGGTTCLLRRQQNDRGNAMFGLSIRSLLIGLFSLMALSIGAEGLLSIQKIGAVNDSVLDVATNWMPAMGAARQINTIAEQGRVYMARHIFRATDDEMRAEEATIAKMDLALAVARQRYESLIASP